MKGEQLHIEIDETTGEITVEVNGVVGKGCSAIQDAISAALGNVVETKTKPEYFKVATVQQNKVVGR